MNDNHNQFYKTWKAIEKKAFSPSDEGERKKWLKHFRLFFNRLFEQGPSLRNPSAALFSKLEFLHGFTIQYSNELNRSKFNITIKYGKNGLQFGYDNTYFSEIAYLEQHMGKEISQKSQPDLQRSGAKKKRQGDDKAESKKILESIIVHPAQHCHIETTMLIESKTNATSDSGVETFPHDIRIGTGTRNPFLFLYQVSFQFLLLLHPDKRKEELKRLLNVIADNKGNLQISPGKLFRL